MIIDFLKIQIKKVEETEELRSYIALLVKIVKK